jgi:hypothetical protein
MLPHPAFLIGFGLLINVADTVPRYDVTTTCRKAIVLAGEGPEGRSVESCVAGEEAAREDLDKQWAELPTGERTQCIGTMAVGGPPSYVELLICLEMMREARTYHQEEETNAKQSSGRVGSQPISAHQTKRHTV